MQGKVILIVLANSDISAHFPLSIDVQAYSGPFSFMLPRSGLVHWAVHTKREGFLSMDCCPSEMEPSHIL